VRFGTLRSHPEIKWHRNPSDIERLGCLQEKILDCVAPCLKPGGVIVYSTCTLTRDENEQVVKSFITIHREFELEIATGYLPEQSETDGAGELFHGVTPSSQHRRVFRRAHEKDRLKGSNENRSVDTLR
jgi:16S rRNA (cytosine967-C5)-methyltransferase